MKNKYNIIFFLLIIVFIGSYFYYSKSIDIKEETPIKENIEINEEDYLKIYFMDVGQADCILIDNNKNYVLIDGGNTIDGKKLVKYFKNLGIEKFDYVIGTHPHEDHIGGLNFIIYNFKIDHFLTTNIKTNYKSYTNMLNALENENIKLEVPNINDTFKVNDLLFKVLYIDDNTEDINASSIVLEMNYKDTSYLFTADITTDTEKKILDSLKEVDVLKVAHHGSQYASSAQFLLKTKPKYAIISVGKDNEYGYPKQVVLDKLNELNTKVYRTDELGTIILSSNGKNIEITNEHTDTNKE